MKPSETGSVIRMIKLILDAAWYGAIAAVVLAVGISVVLSGIIELPWYRVQVELTPLASQYELKLAKTGVSLTFEGPNWAHEKALEATGDLAILPPNGLFAVAYNVIKALSVAFTLAVIYLLRKLFSALKDTSPFTRANALRVRAIGLFIFLGHFAVTLLGFALHNYLSLLVVTRGLSIRTNYHPSYQILFLGLVLIAIAELFRHGVALEEEQALTV